MLGLLFGLAAAVVVLTVLLALALNRMIVLMSDVTDDQTAGHAKCIAHIADVTSKRVVALAFRDAAARYDSVEEHGVLARIGREQYKPAGPSVPALWLTKQADELDPPTRAFDGTGAEYTLDGRRVL